jgi:hypothetical protein
MHENRKLYFQVKKNKAPRDANTERSPLIVKLNLLHLNIKYAYILTSCVSCLKAFLVAA